jgi:hypothetical protein
LEFGDIRNNLFMGPGEFVTDRQRERRTGVLDIEFQDPRSVLDYNAHRVGLPFEKPFLFGGKAYVSLKEMAQATGHEQHGMTVQTYEEIFVEAEEPEHAPNNKGRLYRPSDVDLQLKKSAPVVDAGQLIPGLNEDYTGEAPDLGAYESGKPVPHYGPRAQKR